MNYSAHEQLYIIVEDKNGAPHGLMKLSSMIGLSLLIIAGWLPVLITFGQIIAWTIAH
jgi:hypothetical protein